MKLNKIELYLNHDFDIRKKSVVKYGFLSAKIRFLSIKYEFLSSKYAHKFNI